MQSADNASRIGQCDNAMTLRDLAGDALGLSVDASAGDVVVRSLAYDSRQVGPGSVFVAISGHQADGHTYAPAAVNAGASALVVEHQVDIDSNAPQIVVPDSRRALARLSRVYTGLDRMFADNRLHLAAVTGTNGKTTVTYLLQAILQRAGHGCGRYGTIEYDLGTGSIKAAAQTTPESLELSQMLAEGARAGVPYAVLEASSHAIEQHRVGGLDFTVAVFTNLTGDHLDYHQTMDAYAAAKAGLFESLPTDSSAVVNVDDSASQRMIQSCDASVVRFGLDRDDVDWSARDIAIAPDGTTCRIVGAGVDRAVRVHLIGRHNIQNALAAIAAAVELGVSADCAIDAVEQFITVPGRLEPVPGSNTDTVTVLVDYAHTDDALKNVLQAVRPTVRGRLVVVFGCGGDRDRTKRPRMAAVAEELADVVVITSDNPRTEDPDTIIADVVAGLSDHARDGALVEADRARAIERAIMSADDGDVVLIAGKGHEDYQILGTTKIHFDDVEVAAEVLQRRNGATRR